MIKQLKSSSDEAVSKIARILPRFNPNFITIAGLLPPILFFWLLSHHCYGWALLALVGTVFDSVDGAYARATGQATKFGAFLDSTTDRLSDALIISAFGFAGLVCWEVAIALLVASFLISYVRSAGSAVVGDSKLLAIGPIERAQRLGIIFLGLAAYKIFPEVIWLDLSLIQIAFLALLVLSALTVLRRIDKARQLS